MDVFDLFKMETSPSFRVLYNSIGANASINHLHFHLLNLEGTVTDLPIENTKMMEVLTKDFDGERVVI